MATLDLGMFELIVKRGLFYKTKVSEELMELFFKPMKTSLGRKGFLHFAKCLDNHNLMEIERDLRNLMIPVLILGGDADPYLGAGISEKLHREIPVSRLVRFPRGGHFIQEDEPEKIVREIIGFLRGEHAADG